MQIPKIKKRNHKEKFVDGSERRPEWQDHGEKSCQREHQPRIDHLEQVDSGQVVGFCSK